MEVEIINTLAAYKKALQHLAELMEKNPAPGSEGDNILSLLVLIIKDYEQRTAAPICLNPIEAIKFRMEQMHLTRKELIPYLGSISKVSEVLSGKRNLSLPMIRKLHQGLGIPLESLVLSVTPPSSKRKARRATFKLPTMRRRRKTY